MTADDLLNDLLVTLFQELLDIEEDALIVGEFSNLTMNDMHVIEAIGLEAPKKMNEIARLLSVTTGTLTKAMDGLERKGYVIRSRDTKDKRVVKAYLTEQGVRAYHHHAAFHSHMIEEIKEELSEQELEVVVRALARVVRYFRHCEEE